MIKKKLNKKSEKSKKSNKIFFLSIKLNGQLLEHDGNF